VIVIMATSTKAFLIELYEEYLEEASFLYAQRRTLFSNPEITWKKIGEFEERLEAHVDGLVVGDQLALEVCVRHAEEGDFGELYAATCVFCRRNERDRVLAILDQLDPGDAEKVCAVADALKYELPEAWYVDLLTLLGSGDPKLVPILARAFGYRRVQCGPQLLTAMRRCAAPALPEVVWALGRISHEPASGPLLDYLKSEEEPVRFAAAVALARMGEPRAVDYCIDQAPSKAWTMLPLGLAGGRSALPLLTELAEKGGSADCLTALGLLGDPVIVPLLISRLEQEDAAASAATALQCLTGVGLYETVFVPDEVDEGELFESEREQLKQGEKPTRGDGGPWGSNVTRLSQKPEDWQKWWAQTGSRFDPGVRYRNGKPYSPVSLLGALASQDTPHRMRQLAYEELAIRYGMDVPFEADMFVVNQLRALDKIREWVQSSGSRFQDGAWYFAGHQNYY
jgi:uncharacterized protein (TIGR02270 family)